LVLAGNEFQKILKFKYTADAQDLLHAAKALLLIK
jgi:hypothetical protein